MAAPWLFTELIEIPVAPVYIRGEKAGVLKGEDIARQFQDIIEKFVFETWGTRH